MLGILKINKSKFIRSARIKYWHKKASNFPPFLPFFNADELRRAQENTLLNSKVRDIYKSGSAVIDNVLSQEDINLVNNFSDSLQLKAGRTYIQTNLPSSLNEVRNKILKKIEPIYRHFYPKKIDENSLQNIIVALRIDYSFDGIDQSDPTGNWHVDRFVPCINAIYFPNGSNWSAFEKDVGSPLITSKDLKYYIDDVQKKKKTPKEERDKLYVQFQERFKKVFTLENNNMIVGTHHMQHRRGPHNLPGKRIAIFTHFYNFFTRKDLLSLSKQNFR